MNNVECRFDAATGRWLLSSMERLSVTPLAELAPGVWVSRDADGRMAECMIADDSLDSIPPAVRAEVETELGWVPANRGGSDVVLAATSVDLPATSVIHEPGIPYVDRSGSVLVPTEAGTVRVALSDSVLMIDVPVQSTHEWVRISDAASGHVLALGKVQKFGDAFGANVTFALDGSDIHIALTDTPLDPVADRRTRRSQWLDDMLAGFRRQWWRHPWRTRDAARDAMKVARSLGDAGRELRARRFARVVPAVFTVTLAASVVATAIAIGSLTAPGVPGLTVAGTTSAVYDFSGRGSVTVSAGVNADGTIGLVMSDSLLGTRRFGPGTVTSDTDAYRAACRESKNLAVDEGSLPSVTAKYVVSLRADGIGSVLLGTVEMNSEATTFSSVDSSCDDAPASADGSITADVVYSRSTEEFSLPRPAGMTDGVTSWTLAVERVAPDSDAVDGVTRTPVRFTVAH